MGYNSVMDTKTMTTTELNRTNLTPQLFIISELNPGIYRSDRDAARDGELIGDYTEHNLKLATLRLRALNIGRGASTLAIRMDGTSWVAEVDEDDRITWPAGAPAPIEAAPAPVTWEDIEAAAETVWNGNNLVTPTGYSEAMMALGVNEIEASAAWTVRRDGSGDAVYADCNEGFYEVYCENGGEFWCDELRDHRADINLEWIEDSPLTIECDLTERNEYGIPYRNVAYAVRDADRPAFIAAILAKIAESAE